MTNQQPRVLLIDGNPDAAEAVVELLEMERFRVQCMDLERLEHGRVDAAHLLRDFDPHVVLFQASMVYDGDWALLRRLCSMPEGRERLWVISTVHHRKAEAHLASLGSARLQVLPVPFEVDALVQTCRAEAELASSRRLGSAGVS